MMKVVRVTNAAAHGDLGLLVYVADFSCSNQPEKQTHSRSKKI